MSNEATTCQHYVVPRLLEAGWNSAPHTFTEQDVFTDGRILARGIASRRLPKKRTDYVLRYARDVPLAVVEAKRVYKSSGDGLQQAKDYAELLDLKFAYATNGHGIVEFDYLTGVERFLDAFPTPDELWTRLHGARLPTDVSFRPLLTSSYIAGGKRPRYYQQIAVNRTLDAILRGQRRMLLTLATGTGKTVVAFQLCWKLWSSYWNTRGTHRRPKMLYLADRNILVDDPKDKTFATAFGDARFKIEHGNAVKSRDIYFATYQSLARDERRPGLYRSYAPDFFDLIIVDECHRGSASDESNWREILEYFAPAFQLGMTATPKRDDNVDTYAYFGEPLYTYSLRQGIEDGFLAPYRVHRVITSADAAGWRPNADDRDRYGRTIPDAEYGTPDFERRIALQARTEAIARHLTDHLIRTDRFAKTIVFCVDQDHAAAMRTALTQYNHDLTSQHPNYVCRITSNDGDVGTRLLGKFQDPEEAVPVIVTTSQLLTTGVDIPTCANVVLARVINSMTEFKQIIGRGTRVAEQHGKLTFNILDYTGSATRLFADPAFDGEPLQVTQIRIDDAGAVIDEEGAAEQGEDESGDEDAASDLPRKLYFDGGQVDILAHIVHELDTEGAQLRVVQYTDYTGRGVRTLYPSLNALQAQWANPVTRNEVLRLLGERNIQVNEPAAVMNQPDADPFDLLCAVAYRAPLRTRRERAEQVRRNHQAFLQQYGTDARAILEQLLDKYADHGLNQLDVPDALKVPPISERGNVREIISFFGGAERLRRAVTELQELLYAA